MGHTDLLRRISDGKVLHYIYVQGEILNLHACVLTVLISAKLEGLITEEYDSCCKAGQWRAP